MRWDGEARLRRLFFGIYSQQQSEIAAIESFLQGLGTLTSALMNDFKASGNKCNMEFGKEDLMNLYLAWGVRKNSPHRNDFNKGSYNNLKKYFLQNQNSNFMCATGSCWWGTLDSSLGGPINFRSTSTSAPSTLQRKASSRSHWASKNFLGRLSSSSSAASFLCLPWSLKEIMKATNNTFYLRIIQHLTFFL